MCIVVDGLRGKELTRQDSEGAMRRLSRNPVQLPSGSRWQINRGLGNMQVDRRKADGIARPEMRRLSGGEAEREGWERLR